MWLNTNPKFFIGLQDFRDYNYYIATTVKYNLLNAQFITRTTIATTTSDYKALAQPEAERFCP